MDVFLHFLIVLQPHSNAHPLPYPSGQQSPQTYKRPITPVYHFHIVLMHERLDDTPSHISN